VIVWATGSRHPAPIPWMPRHSTSIVIDPARPAHADPTRKIAMPIRKILFRPNMSDSRPHSGIVAISASR